jgi:ribose/xylose/arabinose/galactoside ABC-type transport system permease subunit
MSTRIAPTTEPPTPSTSTGAEYRQQGFGSRLVQTLLTNRIAVLVILLVVVVAALMWLDQAGHLSAAYSPDYMSAALINLVPLALLALAEMLVIISGAGGIDLSLGAIVSLVGMGFGFMYGIWGWPLGLSIILAVVAGALLGAVNGVLIARFGFPPLIATLATYYAFWSLALVSNNQKPVNSPPIQDLYGLSKAVEIPLIGQRLPLVPKGVVIFLLPTVVIVWLLLAKTTFGRRLYAIGTNDVAGAWSGVNVRRTRAMSYVIAGAIAGLVAVVTVSQFASARPDAGTSGNGMALPAITIAVLGGVAVAGGAGRASGIVLATLLVVWLNAGILLAFSGNAGGQVQLLALGLILVGSALLNTVTARKYSGAR